MSETADFSSPSAASSPPKTIKVRNVIDPVKLRADCSYSTSNLNDAMQQQAGLVAEYTRLQALASRQVDDLETGLEAAESMVARIFRDRYVEKGEKFTEAQLSRDVVSHPNIRAFKKAINEAKQIETIAKGAVQAIKDRRDMLVQLGASERQEREGEVRIMSMADREARVAALKDRYTTQPGAES